MGNKERIARVGVSHPSKLRASSTALVNRAGWNFTNASDSHADISRTDQAEDRPLQRRGQERDVRRSGQARGLRHKRVEGGRRIWAPGRCGECWGRIDNGMWLQRCALGE